MKKTILIITDSVSLPRKTKRGYVKWEDTYYNKLKLEFPRYEFIYLAIGGATILDLCNQLNYYDILKPDVVILQCGIVDCCPRAFSQFEKQIIKKFKLSRLSKPFVKFLRKYRALKYVPLAKYEAALLEIKEKLNPSHFFSLSIIKAQKKYELTLKGISKNIRDYNNILKKHTKLIDLSSLPVEGILDDYHHINELGHDYIKEQLVIKFRTITL